MMIRESGLLLPDVEADGRVCVQYTDPITSKVKEEIRGKNHVYIEQLMTVNWQTAVMRQVPLLITENDRPINPDFPVLPGKTLGYGVPGEGSSGIYKGSFRAAESYSARETKESCSSKFVYDFTPTQALGNVGHIGLTYQFSKGKGLENCFIKNRKPYWAYKSYAVFVDNVFYYIPDRIYGANKICMVDSCQAQEQVVDLSQFVDVPKSPYSTPSEATDIGYSPQTNSIFLLKRYYERVSESGATVYYYYTVIFEFNRALSALIHRYEIKSKDAYILTSRFAVYNNKLYTLCGKGKAVDCYSLSTGEKSTIQVEGEFGTYVYEPNIISFVGPLMALGAGSYPNRECRGIVFDLERGTQYGCLSNDPNEYNDSNGCIHKNLIHGGQTFAFACSKDYRPSYPMFNGFAITDYRLPDGAPQRPAGYGMTITYELEVFW